MKKRITHVSGIQALTGNESHGAFQVFVETSNEGIVYESDVTVTGDVSGILFLHNLLTQLVDTSVTTEPEAGSPIGGVVSQHTGGCWGLDRRDLSDEEIIRQLEMNSHMDDIYFTDTDNTMSIKSAKEILRYLKEGTW